MRGRRWTNEEIAAVAKMSKENYSIKEMAVALNRPIGGITHCIYSILGGRLLQCRKWSPEKVKLAVKLRNEGLSFKQIGERIGVSDFVVAHHLNAYGVQKFYANKKWVPEKVEKLSYYIKCGYSLPTIARKMEESENSIRYAMKQNYDTVVLERAKKYIEEIERYK